MKKFFSIALAAVLVSSMLFSCNKKGGHGTTPLEDSIAQLFGKGFGTFIKQQATEGPQANKDFDASAFLKGLKIVLECDTSDVEFLNGLQAGQQIFGQIMQISMQEGVTLDKDLVYKNIEKVLTSKGKVNTADLQKIGKEMEAMIEVARKQTLARTLKEGNDYIAQQLKADKDLKKTASGLVYKITKKGNGVNFKQDDDVMVKYKGTHIDGTVFDESQKATPMMVSNGQLIPGFVEILKLMSPGAKAHVIIPANLAYGEMGSIDRMSGTRSIKGNETLVFDIETGNLATEADLKATKHSVEAYNQGR